MKISINDLREHLFATIEALRDDEKPMEVERARAIAEVAAKIIDTAKVEIQFADVTGKLVDSKFLPEKTPPKLKALPRKAGNA